ncbi:hypothetical protein D9613_001123 [Agrocybe pediades]|uniref:Rho GTPase activating protein 22 n=1 Tax=Agrocybe pediades TaxID=84607 RepID=A0A8H4VSJ0_9AGAR|nr:hypothetical protein D9613_001123 [Agrocybe pediades]
MAPRRGLSPNLQTQQDSLTPNGPSSALQPPRSTSPSSGFTQFLTKPSKWFTRSASTSKVPSASSSSSDVKSVAGPGPRKHKISRPTDPRPILDAYAAGGASKSVLDLSARPQGSLELSRFHNPSVPSSPTTPGRPSGGGGLGDLRNISRKAWSRSADDLSKVSPVPFSPIQTSFKERVAEYRNRSGSNASAVSPSSPSSGSVLNGRHPFPTVGSTSPSSSPPRSATLPAVSISITTAAPEEDILQTTSPTHVHTRSHSFTPKLPSKLSTPRYPPSPQRANERGNESPRDLQQPPPPLPITPTKAAFGFGHGGSSQSKATQDSNIASSPTARRATTLLPPPTIVEPNQQQEEEEEESPDAKRSSQVLYHSGFINRMIDLPANFTHSNLSLAKGWKPFKLELKGSKLHFYKPPGDRANAIKDLFPVGLIPPSEEEADIIKLEPSTSQSEDLEGGSGRSRKAREEGGGSTAGRKKRAYWGRKTHPDLFLDASGNIEKGTYEALTHESVFATTFSFSENPPADKEDAQPQESKEKWQEFAASIMFSVPSIIGRSIFETEFLRCCSFLISGAEDESQEDMRSRVAWLVNEYLRYYGQPVDAAAFEEWKKESLPGVHLSAQVPNFVSDIPASTSTHALFQPSPIPGSSSPFVSTFSPRPAQDSTSLPLLEALFPAAPSYGKTQSPRQGGPPSNSRFPWAILQEEGLTRDILLSLDPHLVARSLTLYHRSVLDLLPDNISADFLLDKEQPSDTNGESGARASEIFATLFGSEDHPHWLTKIVLLHILGTDTQSGGGAHTMYSNYPASPGRRSEERQVQTSRTHSRSELISVWARIGDLCRQSGDACSWRAILAGLCSRPVARLDKAWKRVDPQALAAIESWATVTSDGEVAPLPVPQTTVWGGATKFLLNEELGKAAGSAGESVLSVAHVTRAKALFESFRTSFALCPRKTLVAEGEITEDIRQLASFWRNVAAEGGVTSGMAARYQRVEQFMSLSMAVEPKRRGLFEPYFWSRASSPSSSLVPLLFPEPLPTLTLFDRSKLARGRYDSDASDIQHLRGLDAQLRQEAGRQLHSLDMKQDFTKRMILGHGGTAISVYDGELILVVQSGGFESTPNSRPSSSRAPSVIDIGVEKPIGRNPSIRVKPSSSQGLDRKTSIARRSSLPSVSHLNRSNFITSEPSSDPPLRVIVQAGTLNNLVNVLVHGLDGISVSVADDNGEISLREGMTRDLIVDRSEFARVWWNVFRSFVTPFVFFELLRKIYISSQPSGSSPTISEYIQVINKRIEVLETIREWITVGGGAQDILDDADLYKAVDHFLQSPLDHTIFKSVMFGSNPVEKAWDLLMESKRTLKVAFMAQTMRPTIHRGLHNQASHGRSIRNRNLSTRELPDMDKMDPESFVDNLDGMASAAFSNVSHEDLYITADLLEVQTCDRTGWFAFHDVASVDEHVEIQTMYTHVQDVEPSSLISEPTNDSLYRLLPPGIRSCIRAFSIIRKWLISRIVAPGLGLKKRQARLELLVQTIEVARLRNTETPASAQLMDQACVRSFVEAVVTSALLSMESRLHFRAWQSVGASRNSQCETFASLLLRPYVQSASTMDSLTVDMGWLLERMLEIIATPDVIEATSQEGQNLINFDKRRHLCNLITKASCIPSARKNATSDESNKRGFERLNSIEKEVSGMQFDHRGIKEEAMREATTSGINGTPSMKKAIRPFHKVIAIQIEKNRRDKALRIRLQKEKLQEQSKNERRDDMLNKAMRPRNPLSNLQKQHRNKKSMSAFLNFMRPISSAFVSDSPQQLTLRRTPSQLDFACTGKPSLVISILDAQVAQFINNERSYIFQLDTEDGGHYLLQAINKREMLKWLETISRVTKNAAKRRLTYLGNSPKPQLSDHIHHQPIIASRDPKAVFGVELEFLLRREAGSTEISPGSVPRVIEECLSEVERRGLNEVGIYRIAGATTEINALRDAYNRGESPIRENTDVHAICDLVKSWFRLLPDPVFPATSYHEVMEAMRQENLDDRLLRIRQVVQSLPPANFSILRRVTEHLDKVTDYEEYNHMTAEALAIVFSPNLLRAPQNDFVMILNNMGLSHKLVKALITHFHTIFDESDGEAEVHSEDELDSPILEEDEPLYDEPMHDLHDDQTPFESGHDYTPN